jgi:hypothetical protein
LENIEVFADDERLCRLVLDARWGERDCHLNARMYGRIRTVMNLLQGAAGSTAFAGFFAGYPVLTSLTGLVVAVLAVISTTIDFSARAIRFESHARKYAELDTAARTISTDEFARRLRELQNEILEGEVEALRHVARKDVLRENGLEEEAGQHPLTRTQRFFALIA